jgi:hypothetical protein
MAHPAMAGAADAHEAQAEAFLLQYLRDAGTPVNPDDVFERGRQQDAPLSYALLRSVIWSLVGRGVVVVTNDWRLQLAR